MQIGKWRLLFSGGGVFLVNFNFSFSRIPRVASLPFFLVLFVADKIKISTKILARFERLIVNFIHGVNFLIINPVIQLACNYPVDFP